MQHSRSLRRSVLLALSLLSACAASDPTAPAGGSGSSSAAFLTGRFAATQSDLDFAADEFQRALADDPDNPELRQQAFLSALMVGRPEAAQLARQQPDSPAAQLLLADTDASAGRWESAETRYAALPRQGLTQILQPLLVAWAQQGDGRTDAALATLRPFIEGQRFRAVYALHAAMIADLAGRTADAAALYHTAETEFGGTNLQLARILANFQARQFHTGEATATMTALTEQSDEFAIASAGLLADVDTRPIRRPTDGIAEAYFALAAALRAQDANDFAVVLLRLAIDMRPDFTAARLLAADVMDSGKHPAAALQMLAEVSDRDPLAAVVRQRRAALAERMGDSDQALRELDEMARDYPERPEPLALKGDILRGKRRFADAVTAYDQAVARVPHPERANWPLFYNRAIALERAHQWNRAEADFEHALALSPDQPYVMNYLGYSWTEQGRNLPRARQMIERAVAQRPNDGSIVDSLGWVSLRQGDVAGAVKSLERVVELDPEDSEVNGHLGDAYQAAGRKLEAQFQWRRALNLNPDPDDAAKLQAKLHEGEAGAPPPATAEKAP